MSYVVGLVRTEMVQMPVETIDFGPLRVTFDEHVLRPRPWTMLQASWAAELSSGMPPGPVLELCSGAGHIGQAAAVLTGRALVQVDADPHACSLAEANAATNVTSPVELRCGDLAAVLAAGERFPLVLADPPYLPREEVEEWPDDPAHAVDGGPDGLDVVRRCLAVAGAHVTARGAVLLQVLGAAQVDALGPDMDTAGLRLAEIRTVDERRAVALLRPQEVPVGGRSGPHGTRVARRSSNVTVTGGVVEVLDT
jgi:methylase of polypeptide subunit release factors